MTSLTRVFTWRVFGDFWGVRAEASFFRLTRNDVTDAGLHLRSCSPYGFAGPVSNNSVLVLEIGGGPEMDDKMGKTWPGWRQGWCEREWEYVYERSRMSDWKEEGAKAVYRRCVRETRNFNVTMSFWWFRTRIYTKKMEIVTLRRVKYIIYNYLFRMIQRYDLDVFDENPWVKRPTPNRNVENLKS